MPSSIDGWLRMIALTIPAYLTLKSASEEQSEAIDESSIDENNKITSVISLHAYTLFSILLCILAIQFWQLSERFGMHLFSLLFVVGYLIIVSLSMIFIFGFSRSLSR